MKVIEHSLPVSLSEFLERPLFCFLTTLSEEGTPRVSPLWYLWEDEQIWILADTVGKSYPDRVKKTPDAAIAIVDFDVHAGRVEHVGMRGVAQVVPMEPGRTDRLLGRYLGSNQDEWDERFTELDGNRWRFIRFTPETVVARDQSFSPSLD
jgi:predicted pyridoxine 5'-phosphate oxidase superfamily flavin-nucleotide-binding protein